MSAFGSAKTLAEAAGGQEEPLLVLAAHRRVRLDAGDAVASLHLGRALAQRALAAPCRRCGPAGARAMIVPAWSSSR